MHILSTPRRSLRALLVAALTLVVSGVAMAAPGAKFTKTRIVGEQLLATITDKNGSREVVAEKSGMLSNAKILIVDSGYAVLYQTRGSAKNGYENESDAVKRFDIYGTKKTLLNEPFRVRNLRETRAKRGRIVYIVSMQDGGAGIPTLYVIDSTLGELWQKSAARFTAAQNGTLEIALFPSGEEAATAPPIGKISLDLERVLDGAYRNAKP